MGLCVASAHSGFAPAEVVITDQADHLELIRRNARANGLSLPPTHQEEEGEDKEVYPSPPQKVKPRLRVQEFDWVSGAGVEALGLRPYDVVLGTDVAYCEELYAPVVKVGRWASGGIH